MSGLSSVLAGVVVAAVFTASFAVRLCLWEMMISKQIAPPTCLVQRTYQA